MNRPMNRPIRIGCGSGFWGDTALGAAQLVERGDIDVLVLDYLAEITMSILARMRARRPDAGYATDFVDAVIAPLAPQLAARRIKVVANAGGVNPAACKARVAQVLAERGVALEVATVTGDDVLGRLDELRAAGALDLETGRPLPAHALSANAYLGAFPIAEALRRGADIVITGRCVDSALALGPLIAAYGWTPGDLDRLAQGSLAGHVIECGVQATGGLSTDWRRVERGYADMGFPIVECEPDGSFTVGKPGGTGGLVAPETVGEQIAYEVHDPARYALPDVVCDFTRGAARPGRPRPRAGDRRARPAAAGGLQGEHHLRRRPSPAGHAADRRPRRAGQGRAGRRGDPGARRADQPGARAGPVPRDVDRGARRRALPGRGVARRRHPRGRARDRRRARGRGGARDAGARDRAGGDVDGPVDHRVRGGPAERPAGRAARVVPGAPAAGRADRRARRRARRAARRRARARESGDSRRKR